MFFALIAQIVSFLLAVVTLPCLYGPEMHNHAKLVTRCHLQPTSDGYAMM